MASLSIEEVVDTPIMAKRGMAQIDLTPYKTALDTILKHPSNQKAIPVTVGEERGEGIGSLRARFDAALKTLEKTKEYDPAKVKLTYRNATPGTKATRVFVKWEPLILKPSSSNGQS